MPSYQERGKMAKGSLTLSLNRGEFARLRYVLDKAGDLDTSPAVQKGLREGANLMKVAGQSNLAQRNKVKTGTLKKSFRIKVTRRKKIGNNYALTGFKRSNAKKGIKGANHAYLVDRGTKRGARGSYFWTDAVNTKGREALNNLTVIIENELNKMLK